MPRKLLAFFSVIFVVLLVTAALPRSPDVAEHGAGAGVEAANSSGDVAPLAPENAPLSRLINTDYETVRPYAPLIESGDPDALRAVCRVTGTPGWSWHML